MKKNRTVIISLVLMFVLTLACSTLHAENLSGKKYYTKTNIWYEDPDKISSTNYHKGAILPIGTKAKMHSIKGEKIQFTPDGSARMFTIINEKKKSMISTDELFNRYFSAEAVQVGVGEYQVTEEERENIKTGTIAVGMSKKAVLLAYGYPPAHKTPLLTSDVWYYWYARLHKVNVYFKDDKVSKIEKMEPAEFPGFTKSSVDSEGGIKKKAK